MPADAITLLQNVKQAEEAKAQAIAQARRDAEARLQLAQQGAQRIEGAVARRVAEEEPRLRGEIQAASKAELEALEVWQKNKLDALGAAAEANRERAVAAAYERFLAEWEPQR